MVARHSERKGKTHIPFPDRIHIIPSWTELKREEVNSGIKRASLTVNQWKQLTWVRLLSHHLYVCGLSSFFSFFFKFKTGHIVLCFRNWLTVQRLQSTFIPHVLHGSCQPPRRKWAITLLTHRIVSADGTPVKCSPFKLFFSGRRREYLSEWVTSAFKM